MQVGFLFQSSRLGSLSHIFWKVVIRSFLHLNLAPQGKFHRCRNLLNHPLARQPLASDVEAGAFQLGLEVGIQLRNRLWAFLFGEIIQNRLKNEQLIVEIGINLRQCIFDNPLVFLPINQVYVDEVKEFGIIFESRLNDLSRWHLIVQDDFNSCQHLHHIQERDEAIKQVVVDIKLLFSIGEWSEYPRYDR